MKMDEMLIELVREKPELYDTNSRQYSDNVHKNKVWDQIGRVLRKSGPECKHRWTSLRSQHRKALHKSMASGRKWKYEDAMAFLEPFKKEKQKPSPFNNEEDDEDDDHEEENEEDEELWDESPKPDPLAATMPSTSTAIPRKLIRQRKVRKTAASTLMKYVLENRNERQIEKSPLELFFLTMANTVRTFSPYDQHVVKNQIFQIVSQVEGKYLTPEPEHSEDNFQNVKMRFLGHNSPEHFSPTTPPPYKTDNGSEL